MANLINIPENGNTWLYDASIETGTFLDKVLGEELEDFFPEDAEADWDHDEVILELINKIEGSRDNSDNPATYYHAARGNVCNNENDFSDVFTYSVWAPNSTTDWMYADEVYVTVCHHLGGDVRGNYGGVRIFKVDALAESGFFDWVMGWYCETISERDNERLSVGYSSNPTNELESIFGDEGFWFDGAFLIKAVGIGCEYHRFYPDLHLDGA